MPSVEQILETLQNISTRYQTTAVLWHFYFALITAALLSGARPSKKYFGIALSFPLLSVSAASWLVFNPFNGTVFLLAGLILLYFSFKMPDKKIEIAPVLFLSAGIVMVIFGWVYPHFIDTSTYVACLYKAPTGIIPCATLSIIIGFSLIGNNLNSRAFSITLGIIGLFYGLTGAAQLKVSIDWILLAGAVTLLIRNFIKVENRKSEVIEKQSRMTVLGVGPNLALVAFPYLALALAAHFTDPELMRMSDEFHIGYAVAGIMLIIPGLYLWGTGALKVEKAFKEGKLVKTGSYSFVRNPMYSAFIVFLMPGIAIWMRSWALLSVPFIGAVAFWYLIRKEEEYLENKFGEEYTEYKSRVNSLIPFLHLKK